MADPETETRSIIGILGSGIMASGIAELAARHGHPVVLRARNRERAELAVANIASRVSRSASRGHLEAPDGDAILARIRPTDALADLSECHLVIESVVEELAVKCELLAAVDRQVSPNTIVATNTSTLPVIELAMSTSRPDRVCGLHFFNPATVMNLVEVVRPITASDETISQVTALATSWGRTTVEVSDRAGFVVNALLFPYLNAAISMAERGVASIDDIDVAMRGGCGFPMGPFELLDLVGLDTSLSILDALHSEFGDPSTLANPWLRRLVAAGLLGRKSGQGFRTYS